MADQKFVFVKALLKKYHKWCDEQDAGRKASHKRKINRGDIYVSFKKHIRNNKKFVNR